MALVIVNSERFQELSGRIETPEELLTIGAMLQAIPGVSDENYYKGFPTDDYGLVVISIEMGTYINIRTRKEVPAKV